jgi:hypothetical protein
LQAGRTIVLPALQGGFYFCVSIFCRLLTYISFCDKFLICNVIAFSDKRILLAEGEKQMLHRRAVRKAFAAFFALCFCIALFSSCLYVASYTEHSCTGEHCPTCEHLQECSQVLHPSSPGSAACFFPFRACFLVFCGAAVLSQCSPHSTLLLLHIRLND